MALQFNKNLIGAECSYQPSQNRFQLFRIFERFLKRTF